MANPVPMWWMRSGRNPQQSACPKPAPSPVPPPKPPFPPCRPEKPCPQALPKPEAPSNDPLTPLLSSFSDRLRHMDSETMLLLALLWLLWQENADRRLLLALAYIVL